MLLVAKEKVITRVAIVHLIGGQAKPGTTLASYGINMAEFTRQFNDKTKDRMGEVVPVQITAYSDKSFKFIIKTTPASVLLKKAAGIETASGEPNKKKVAKVSKAKVQEIAETKMKDQEIYNVYHRLWRIEETFRTLKSELDARPAYVQRQDSIYGHFFICYLAMFALRVLQIKKFKDEIHTNEIISFIRDLNILKTGNTYINLGSKDKIKTINDRLGLNLTNYFLTEKNIEKVLNYKL